ncbi:MAG TPA: MFS transporter [Syntrophomonas sp.]|nr:MFS transporter [Syntrophomonas sp.]
MKNKAWLVTIIVFLAGVTFSAGNFKVPPTMVVLLKEMNTGVAMGGWLMSMGMLAGIILALPAGGIMMKTGPKKLGLFSLACAVLGNLIGAVAPSFLVLMLGRLIEGIGFGLIGVVAPAIIAVWFPPEKRGFPMALWSIWIAVGMLFVFNATNIILPAFGWRGNWWLVTVLAAVILALFAWLVKVPEPENKSSRQEASSAGPVSTLEGFKSPASWLLALVFAVFAFAVGVYTSFLPTFLIETTGMDVATANATSSIATIGMIVGGFIMGFLLNTIKNRSMLLVVSMVITAIFMYFSFKVTSPGMIIPFIFIIGIVYQLIPPIVFTVAPDTAISPATIGISMGIVILGQNLAGFIAPALIGSVVESSGGNWDAATLPLVIAGLIGIAASLLYASAMKKKTSIPLDPGIPAA